MLKTGTFIKQSLLENFDELVTVRGLTQDQLRKFNENGNKDRRAFKGKYHAVHSSGSTGKPGYFVYDNRAWNSMLIGIIRVALWGMSMPRLLKFLAEKPRIAIYRCDGRTLRRRNGGRRRNRRRGRGANAPRRKNSALGMGEPYQRIQAEYDNRLSVGSENSRRACGKGRGRTENKSYCHLRRAAWQDFS